MTRKNPKRHSYRDKIKSKSRDKTSSYKYGTKKYRDDIKVVSTSVSKEKEETKPDAKAPRDSDRKVPNKYENQRRDRSERDTRSRERFNERTKERYRPRENPKPDRFNERKKSSVKRTIIPYTINEIEKTTCPKCKKLIDQMSSAIEDKKTGKLCHFDCISEELKKDLKISGRQRLVYLGSGTFGVIEDVVEDGRKIFVIKNKIEYISK